MRLSDLGARRPVQLSGGQRQRVALARAIVNEPEVLLLDEPLGALDLKLRQEMQTELKRIQREVGITFVYVTHDQEEALTMSDRLAVMNSGRIEQLGAPTDVYERPATEFVAGFIGVSNLIERDGRRITVRPEKVRLLEDDDPAPAGAHVEAGEIVEVTYLGVLTRYVVKLDNGDNLVAARQNLETAAADALELTGRRVRVAWLNDQAYEITSEHHPAPVRGGTMKHLRISHELRSSRCSRSPPPRAEAARRARHRATPRPRPTRARRDSRFPTANMAPLTSIGKGEGKLNLIAWEGYTDPSGSSRSSSRPAAR